MREGAMFVYYFVHVAAPFQTVEPSTLAMVGGLDEFAEQAYRDGEEIRARMGIGGEPPLLAKVVRIVAGRALRGDHETTLPLTWEATGTPELFPQMDADLVVAALGPQLTQLSLRGTYRPPLGQIGRVLDRALLHRLAEASVKRFVDQIAAALVKGEHREAAIHSHG
jgi:hypothetical protein